MNRHMFWKLLLFSLVVMSGCGQEQSARKAEVQPTSPPPTFSPISSERAKKSVAPLHGANASGQFIHPFENEVFDGNLLASVQASDPDGLTMVALSFNQHEQLKLLCEPGDDCPQGTFTKTETNINPASFGVYVGPLTLGLWVLDDLGNQMMVDSVTVNWQLRRISNVTVVRAIDGESIDISWQNAAEIIRYNVVLAAEEGVTTDNYQSKLQGQAKLAVNGGPQSFSGLDPNLSYYIQLTGVDGSGESAFSSELRIAVPSGQPNTPPVVQQESYLSPQNQPLIGNVLTNDSDNESDLLSVSPLPIQFPSNGELQLNRDGSFVYTPSPNFTGTDSFAYEVQDGQGGLSQGSVQISIDDLNDPPVALDDAYTTPFDTPLVVTAPGILLNDSDIDGDVITLILTPVENVQNGSLALQADGGFTYTPNAGFTGNDFFVYQIQDEEGLSGDGRVDIEVGNANQPPVAVNDNYQMDEDTTLIVNASDADALLANDFDPENDTITLTDNLIETVSNGVLTIDIAGNFTYVPDANFYGTDSFIYEIEDSQGNTAQAIATIDIAAVNDAPLALSDNYQTNEDSLLTVSAPGLLGNDTDPDMDSLTVNTSPEVAPSNGQVTLSDDGSFTYQPNSGFNGQDNFNYRITDPEQASDVATVTIDVIFVPTILKGSSFSTTGNLTLEGLGEKTPGSGIGQVRYTLGDCVRTTDTQCTLSGRYSEDSDSEFQPGAQGDFYMVYEYSGVGPTPTIAESISPGNDSVVFNNLGGATFTLTLMPDSGGNVVASFPATNVTSLSFSAFLSTSAVCTGLNQGQPCSVGQVGLTPGSVIIGGVTPFSFVIDKPVFNP
ncbi:Ig-like domain-containing protein [Thalassotalea fusca]